MSGIINLLPESIANQIAAGEVVQRPASVVKELLENAIDAGAEKIKLYIKNGGISYIQVDDDGKGMNTFDARMCWERHATSKIKAASDLYNLNTLGFRGEALASIASVSQVELKTRPEDENIGTRILIDAGKVLEQENTACSKGTSITVKNLFFNIPARKNFLKSITVETKHILDEFQHIALSHPDVAFEFYNQGKQVNILQQGDLQQRIKELFNVDQKDLLASNEDTDIVKIKGFIGSPKLAKRVRGSQFLFANGRYIRDPYLNHAVSSAYSGLLEEKQYPFYVLFLRVDPAKIDVNIHPTKSEVKFEDGRHVYSLLNSVIKKTLSSYFSLPTNEQIKSLITEKSDYGGSSLKSTQPNLRYNPFEPQKERTRSEWEKLDDLLKSDLDVQPVAQTQFFEDLVSDEHLDVDAIFQLAAKFIVLSKGGELWLINQHRAHVQVLFERFSKSGYRAMTQQLLFPRTIELSSGDFQLFHQLEQELHKLGFDISEFGKNTVIINGLPSELSKTDGAEVLQQIFDDFKVDLQSLKLDQATAVKRATAKNAAIKAGTTLSEPIMRQLIKDLLQCKQYNVNSSGAPITIKFDESSLERFFHSKTKS